MVKVLVTDFDLYRNIGGGQTVYRRLVETHPDIEFHYLTRDEPKDAPRPANAHPIPFRQEYFVRDLMGLSSELYPPQFMHHDFVMASNIALSAAGRSFDAVDLPDYYQFGYMLAPALRHHGVEFKRIVIAMHGLISTTISLNWGTENTGTITMKEREKLQFQTADNRYAISKRYRDEWKAICDLNVDYLNPLSFLQFPSPTMAPNTGTRPSLNFIGRTEKRKGPDIFMDLAWWLPRDKFASANVIGPPCTDDKGRDSSSYLEEMKRSRLFDDLKILPSATPAELGELFASRSVVLLPSRYDTLNLIALESLFAGCPTAIGDGAGVVRLLREEMPQIPFVHIDSKNIYKSLDEIRNILENYDLYRASLVKAVRESSPDLSGADLEGIYGRPSNRLDSLNVQAEGWYDHLKSRHDKIARSISRYIRIHGMRVGGRWLSPRSRNRLYGFAMKFRPSAVKSFILGKLLSPKRRNRSHYLRQSLRGLRLPSHYRRCFLAKENSREKLADKLELTSRLAETYWIDRAKTFNEMARVERLRGNDLIAATFELRVMRWMGEDRLGKLPVATTTLEEHGFRKEAEAARAMFGPPEERNERCLDLLKRSYSDHLTCTKREFEIMDDRRSSEPRRISVIVSLYNAATNLPRFLAALQNQTVFSSNEAELVLIDSGSPGDEYRVFKEWADGSGMPVVYARSAQRETIQDAWNRGILLSRGEYLSFLGVDETIVPDCLEVLARELDHDCELDWVIGNSLVTQVNEDGSWLRDIMAYDRTGYRQDLVYLETCYLSWVGALYRRSIHDRFGYYDAGFSAAGDTEFKCRVMPHIRSKSVPRMLGVFLNYPEGCTTLSPRAEIEDLRAWYLHRTPAGVRYAFADRDPREAERLFVDCMKYRKSYCGHWSTDIEHACNLAGFLKEKIPDSNLLGLAHDVERLFTAYRSLEWLPQVSRLAPYRSLKKVRQMAGQVSTQHPDVNPAFEIFNDNRYEQHTFVWRS